MPDGPPYVVPIVAPAPAPAPVAGARRHRLRLEHEDDDARVLVALDDADSVVGLASAGVSRDPDAPTAWELYSITTLTSVHGSGVADELLGAALGERAASLWVLVTNARAQAFYRRHGFVADGATKVHEASGVPEQRMVRPPVADRSRHVPGQGPGE